MGISDAEITFWTGLLIMPWTLKPLWSPILEVFKHKKYFIAMSQLIISMTFIMVALSLPMSDFFTYSLAFLAIISFVGATNDIGTDVLYLNILVGREHL